MESDLPNEAPAQRLRPGDLRALELLRRGRSFLLCGHVRPDGDCLGAEAALASTLASLGKTVTIVNPDPVEKRFEYLSRDCSYGTWRGSLPEHDVAVLLDFCELERTGPMAKPLAAAPSKKLVVDHHLHHGDAWWDEAFVDPGAAATGILVHRIAKALAVRLDPVAARGVFTSIVTDTGWFKYSNTDAETLRVASEMVSLGVDPNRIYSALFQTRPRIHPVFVGRLLSRAEFLAGDRLAVVDLPLSEGLKSEELDSDDVLDLLRSVGAVEVVLYLRELADGTCKLSARSKGDYDVNALARRFGGGGHKKAAGATLDGPLAQVRPRVVAAALEGFRAREADGALEPIQR
ncbi:MAG: DHH family phosphoesterase [Planctomycetota bacterium]